MELTDKEIIRKIKNGEINYYSYIVNKYTTSVFRYIELKIKKKEDVEDLVQNVFISFYKAIDRFDEEKPVKPYLYQIVSNELKMFYRKHKSLLPLKEEIIIEEKLAFAEVAAGKEEILKSLKGGERQMLMMIGDGYSYEEVAKKFKKPLNTVKSIIRRARQKVKNHEKT